MVIDPFKFMSFEEEHHLFDREIIGFHYWQLIRAETYDYILDIQLNHKDRHPDLVEGKKPRFGNALKLLGFSIRHGFNKVSKNKILLSARSTRRNKQVDLTLGLSKKDFVYLNRPVNYEHEIDDTNVEMIYPDFRELIRGLSIVLEQHNKHLKNIVYKEIKDWLQAFENEFDIKLSKDKIVGMVIYSYTSYRVLFPYFVKKLSNIQPSKILVSPYYERFNLILIKAAKELKIQVIEYQHGEISKYHIAYNYLQIHEEYLPDVFLFFGEYWKDTIVFPDKKRILVTGSLTLDDIVKNKKSLSRINDSTQELLFISQGPFSSFLYPFAVSVANALDKEGIDYRIRYKLHPYEVKTWNLQHPDFNDKRIIIETGNLYDLMACVDYQIGITSTALFEGIAFRLKTFIVDCDYLEESDMKKFCDEGYGLLIRNPDEIVRAIKEGISQNHAVDYFWKENSKKWFKRALEIKE